MIGQRIAVRWTAAILVVACVIPPMPSRALSGPGGSAHVNSEMPPITTATVSAVQGPLAISVSREAARLARMAQPRAQNANSAPAQPERCWVCRHLAAFGALVGFGSGCVLGASQVGGSQDDFFNALDELACPVVGAIGAGAGAAVGWALSHVN